MWGTKVRLGSLWGRSRFRFAVGMFKSDCICVRMCAYVCVCECVCVCVDIRVSVCLYTSPYMRVTV